MGYYGKIQERETAIKLRKEGLSYQDILKEISVSKSTLSRWCRDIVLTEKQLNSLQKKRIRGGIKGALVGSKTQQKLRVNQTLQLLKSGRREFGKLSKRDRFVAGVALYFAEGTKTDRVCEFANSDPEAIIFMSEWFMEFCEIPKSKQHGAIWIHDTLSQENATDYWSKMTNIPKENFHKSYIVKSKRSHKKHIHEYGVFSIRFSNARVHREIMGWIAGLLGGAWYNKRRLAIENPL